MIGSTNIKTGTARAYFLPLWKIKCIDKIESNAGKVSNFLRATKTNSLTQNTSSRSYFFYILKRVVIFLDQTFLLNFREQILYKSITSLLTLFDIRRQLVILDQ